MNEWGSIFPAVEGCGRSRTMEKMMRLEDVPGWPPSRRTLKGLAGESISCFWVMRSAQSPAGKQAALAPQRGHVSSVLTAFLSSPVPLGQAWLLHQPLQLGPAHLLASPLLPHPCPAATQTYLLFCRPDMPSHSLLLYLSCSICLV